MSCPLYSRTLHKKTVAPTAPPGLFPAAEEVANRYADLDYVVCSLENY
jgi:hypothetical protein